MPPPVEPPVKINLDQLEVFANQEKKIEQEEKDEEDHNFLNKNPAAERVVNSKRILEGVVRDPPSTPHTSRTKTELAKLETVGTGTKEEMKDSIKRVPVPTKPFGEGKKNLYKIMNKKSRRGKRSRRSRRCRISRRARKSRKHRT